MQIKLTQEQIELLKQRLTDISKETKELEIKRNKGDKSVSRWDIVYLSYEEETIQKLLKNGYFDTED